MAGEEHLDDLIQDFVPSEPCTARKPRPNKIREDVSTSFIACDPLFDDANSCIHSLRRTGACQDQCRHWIALGACVLLSKGFCKRKQSGAALAGSISFQLSVEDYSRSNSGREDAQFPGQAGIAV